MNIWMSAHRIGLWFAVFLLHGCVLAENDFVALNESPLCEDVNECKRSEAEDARTKPTFTINVGADALEYPCIIVSNTIMEIEFTGSNVDLLVGGLSSEEDIDPQSPITQKAKQSSVKLELTGSDLSGRCVLPYFSTKNPDRIHGAIFFELE